MTESIKYDTLPDWVTPEQYAQACKNFHVLSSKRWKGKSVHFYHGQLTELICDGNIQTILDYGCGKGKQWTEEKLHKGWTDGRLMPDMYDPHYEKYNRYPTKKYDLVLCTDVMEHIMEIEVEQVLSNLIRLADKVLFLTITLCDDGTKIPIEIDGVIHQLPAHCTLKPEIWWWKKIHVVMIRLARKGVRSPYIKVMFNHDSRHAGYWYGQELIARGLKKK